MSRILRRPMFRGGRVSSYGTGIASGLADGGRVNYAGGGQIGGGIIYGEPMADGRYGFQNPNLFDVKDVIGETQVGAALSHLKAPTFEPLVVTEKDSTLNLAGKQDEVFYEDQETEVDNYPADDQKTETETETINTWDEYITIGTTEGPGSRFGKRRIKNPNYDPPHKWVDAPEIGPGSQKRGGDKPKKRKVYLTEVEIEAQDFHPGQVINEPAADLTIPEPEVKPELSAREMVEANKELFGDLLGLDKARGQDISDMLMGASAKLLKPGATVRSGLGEFMEAEAVRPGRRRKLEDTAAGLAIQDYIAGKRSKEQIAALTGKIDYEYDKKLEITMPQKDDTAQVALYKIANLGNSKAGSDSTIKEFIKFKTGDSRIYRNDKIKMKDLDNPKKLKKLKIGYNIIEEDGVKNIVTWDGTNYDIVTLEQIWARE